MKSLQEIMIIIKQLRKELQKIYGSRLEGVYLFGSYAWGEADDDSDIYKIKVRGTYFRGVNKQNIFKSDANYRFLIGKVKKYTLQDKIAVIAHCLMPNHYHFLFRQDGNISISKIMQAILNSYTKAFNKMYGRLGTLFEERFKSILVDSEEYITHLCRYIHRNPIDIVKPLVSNITQWHYSNYPESLKLRNGNLVDHNFIKTYFKDKDSYKRSLYLIIPHLRN